ncbi:major facilitator superfamily domain-containing protein, partial [Mycena leptocephala]
LDRSNLENAWLLGLPKGTLNGDVTGKLFDWITSVFFFAYVLCQVPGAIASELFPPRVWFACSTIVWGVSSTLMVRSSPLGRVFLGIFEAGFVPAITLYIFCTFNLKPRRNMAYWFGIAAVAGTSGGLIAFGVQHAHAAIHTWRILLIIEVHPPPY